MRNQINIKNIFSEKEKAKRYVRLQDKGVSQMEATYRVFGNEVGDEMLKMRQHEVIFDQPNYN